MTDHRIIADRANKAGLTVNGVPVRVTGVSGPYATVTVTHGPLSGFSCQYAWPTIERATGSGALS